MSKLAWVLTCLACVGHGRRAQLSMRSSSESPSQSYPFDVDTRPQSSAKSILSSTQGNSKSDFNPLGALTLLLLALSPAAAFVSTPGRRHALNDHTFTGARPAAPVMAETKKVAIDKELLDSKFSRGREARRKLSKGQNRAGFKEEKAAAADMMAQEYTSPLVAELRANGGTITRGDVTVKLAEKYGWCRGVERSVAMAYQTRSHFPKETIHLTNKIIHNPQVDDRLREMDIQIIEPAAKPGGMKNFDNVKEGDVVVLPAFGATLEEMQLLSEKKVKIVDTTCPWVSKVWNAVDKHIVDGRTTIIHGKWAHEESIATASFCEHYLIVKDQAEADYVVNYILNGGSKAEFMEKFKNAMSKGFDPDKHLKKLGIANQTTMYRKETKQIGRTFEDAMLKKYGPESLSEHYAEFDTICDATQERQDAVTEMSNCDDKLDFVLVVGGWDSSNTAHLKEIPEKFGVRAYHIDRAERIGADNTLEHREEDGSIVTAKDFLKKGPVTIGVTSGASTPDVAMQDALERIFMIHKLL